MAPLRRFRVRVRLSQRRQYRALRWLAGLPYETAAVVAALAAIAYLLVVRWGATVERCRARIAGQPYGHLRRIRDLPDASEPSAGGWVAAAIAIPVITIGIALVLIAQGDVRRHHITHG